MIIIKFTLFHTLGVACTTQTQGYPPDSLAALTPMQERYLKSCPLSQDELAALPVLVGMRVALSVVVGVASAQADPDNVAYLLLTQKPGWLMLGALQQHDLSTSLGLDRLCC